ncbi:hypothetical protein V6Z11_D04G207800 [Gossypium hirsutum]
MSFALNIHSLDKSFYQNCKSHYILVLSFGEKKTCFSFSRAEEMEEIDTVNLVANHVHKWWLRDRSGTLPAGRIVLMATEDENQWWRFECGSEGDRHYITGTEWSRFVQPRIDARLTLYAQQDGENFHRMKVTMRRN